MKVPFNGNVLQQWLDKIRIKNWVGNGGLRVREYVDVACFIFSMKYNRPVHVSRNEDTRAV
jgi:hypothetical protein